MSYIDPVKLRRKFNTEAGREAFDRLQQLGNPRWVLIDEGAKVYLSPSIEIKEGPFLGGTGAGWGQNIDDIVIQQEKEIIEKASKPGAVVVANAYQPTRREYDYDAEKKTFTRRTPGQKGQRTLFG